MFKKPVIIFTRPLWAPNPDMYGGTGLILVFMVVLLLINLFSCTPAHSQSWAPREERTVSWYLRNKATLDFVTVKCRDNPGLLRRDPDCINASEARSELAQREIAAESALRGAGHVMRPTDLTPPSSERYWRDRPEERREKLAYCSRMTEDQQRLAFCVPAQRAESALRTRRS